MTGQPGDRKQVQPALGRVHLHRAAKKQCNLPRELGGHTGHPKRKCNPPIGPKKDTGQDFGASRTQYPEPEIFRGTRPISEYPSTPENRKVPENSRGLYSEPSTEYLSTKYSSTKYPISKYPSTSSTRVLEYPSTAIFRVLALLLQNSL